MAENVDEEPVAKESGAATEEVFGKLLRPGREKGEGFLQKGVQLTGR